MVKKYVGASHPRIEAKAKIRGEAKYIDDITFSDMLWGITIRSPVARGRLVNIQFDEQIDWNEFVIVTHKDIPGKNHIAHIMNDQPCLVHENINHAFEPILLLAHKDKYYLNSVINKIHLEIEKFEPVLTLKESMERTEIIWGTDNIIKSYTIEKGDIDSIWEKADFVFEREYLTGAQEHLYLETNGIIAKASPKKGILVMGTMQCPYFVEHALLDVFDLPKEKITVVQTETGGAFGGKEDYSSMIAAHAALLALKSGKPVKIIYDREEDMLATTKRHPSWSKYKTAVDKDFRIIAMEINFYLDGGAYSSMSPVVLSRGAIHAGGPYYSPNIRITSKAFATNTPPHGAFRGFGAPQSLFALEKHINDLAKHIGIEPDKLRLKNFIRPGLDTSTGQVIRDNIDMQKLLDEALEKSNYHKKIKLFKNQNKKSSVKKGIGFATFMHGAGFTGSGEKRLASTVAAEATLDGHISILASSTEMGQGKNTVFTQIAADELKISPKFINIISPDTSKVPDSGPTVASRTTMVIGKLVEEACKKLKTLLIEEKFLSPHYSEKNFIAASMKYIKKHGSLKIFSQYKEPPGTLWDEKNHRGDAYSTFAWAAYVAEVSVDMNLFEVTVDNFWAIQEVGKVVNPTLAEGQIEGGVAQGIGFTLYENVTWQEGKMLNANMNGYIIPTSIDIPHIKVIFKENSCPYGPQGAKGIGELPMDGPAPAIANAIENATGISFNKIPILPENIMKECLG